MTPHGCNNELACPECVRDFWKWAERHTRGRAPKSSATAPSFYEAAAKFIDVDHRAVRVFS